MQVAINLLVVWRMPFICTVWWPVLYPTEQLSQRSGRGMEIALTDGLERHAPVFPSTADVTVVREPVHL